MKGPGILIVFIFCCQTIFAQQTDGPKTYALVIGVAKYLDPKIPQLQFANRDAEIFADFLKSKAGGSVPKENIRLLVDETATSGAVINAIYWLKDICNKGDKVYIYFSGHGDLENITMYNNGFLICYDSPPFNYVNLALSIDYLNDIANTISIKKQANVIMITDACHSGKMTEKIFKGNFLAGNQLRTLRNNEIRITSSSADQLSNEKADWGGGRGVFSYYLINGLKGLAAKSNSDKITLDDIKNYLDSSLKNDLVLKQENIIQTPVVNGKGNFILSQIDTIALITAKNEITQDTLMQRMMMVTSATPEENTPDQYFYNLLKEYTMEVVTDSFSLNDIPAESIPFALIDSLINQDNEVGKSKLLELKLTLLANKEWLKEFKNTLATLFDEAGQRVITQYLRGDAAELERRRYYNANYNGYNVYPLMFQVALKLTSPDNKYYYNNLKVKLHYFTGVTARLKIPLTEVSKQAALIDIALAEQKKALAMEKYAAYIYNEIGVLYSYKNNNGEAEKYFKTAALRAPGWAIPRSNLADLYTEKGQLEKAILYADSAKVLQPGFQDIYMSYGLIYEKKGNLLQAEEAFQKSIKLNSRHFLPYERLGYVYLDNSSFAIADSMFFEAGERKKGFLFDEFKNPRHMKLPKPVIENIDCILDKSTIINRTDLKGNLAVGLLAYRDMDLVSAESALTRVIGLDPHNPLAYHYLAKTLIELKRLPEAELMLKKSMDNYLPYTLWTAYADSLYIKSPNDATDQCIEICFTNAYYEQQEDYVLLASLYESWGRFNESEEYYKRFIETDPAQISGYNKLAGMYEKAGRYNEAENLLTGFSMKHEGLGVYAVKSFYDSITTRFPDNTEWNLKAGIFHYNIAKKEPGKYLNDSKSINSFTGETFYTFPQRPVIKMPKMDIPRLISYGAKIPGFKFIGALKPFTDGILFLKKAIENNSYDEKLLADVNAKIGDMYVWQGLPDSAVYFYQAAIELDPANTGTRQSLIEAYGLSYRYTEALSQLDSLAGRNELNRSKQLLYIAYAIQEGDQSRAEKRLLDAEALDRITLGETPELIALKAKYRLMLKDHKGALQTYTRLYQINKQDNITIYTIARLHAISGNKTDAWNWLDMALNAGFNYKYVVKEDPALKLLHKDNRWKKMIDAGNWKKYYSLDEQFSAPEAAANKEVNK